MDDHRMTAVSVLTKPHELTQDPDLEGISPIPTTLRLSEGLGNLLAAVGGIVGGYLCALGISSSYPKESMLGRTFDFDVMTTVIPVAIICMFLWGLLLCGWRALRTLGLQSACRNTIVHTVVAFLSKTSAPVLERQLTVVEAEQHPLLKRVLTVTRQWLFKPGFQEADLVLQQQMAQDDEHVHGSYSLIRAFIWALPVLGLIGTVIGISLAVSGFADFLAGNIDDVAAIKKHLVGVTSGLSFAFLITLFGLVTALVLMLLVSVLQTRESALYATIHRNLADHFLPALQRVAPVQAELGPTQDIGLWQQALQRMVEGFLSEMTAKSGRIIEALEARQTIYQAQVEKWASTLREVTEAGAKSLGTALVGLESTLLNFPERTTSQLAPRLEHVSDELSQLRNSLDGNVHLNTQYQETLQSALQNQTKAVDDLRSVLSSLAETTQALVESRASLQDDLQTLVNGTAANVLRDTTGALSQQIEETRELGRVAERLQHQVAEVLRAQQSLHEAVTQLKQSGMAESFHDFRVGMGSLLPILQSFRGPFVFQAVPMADGNGSPRTLG
ncbi:MAG: MotA/TolQ/ExbB proton channel family protein [Nitrospira sp.]